MLIKLKQTKMNSNKSKAKYKLSIKVLILIKVDRKTYWRDLQKWIKCIRRHNQQINNL